MNPEENLYFDFVTKAGALLPESSSSWANVFLMQHHGLPTRLLDWTETFSVALYFALKGAQEEAAIWLLDPYGLNKKMLFQDEIIHPEELGTDYEKCFIDRTASPSWDVVAISPLRHNPRMSHQRAGFTLHCDISAPLEVLCPAVVRKIHIGKRVFADGWRFLELAGLSESAVYPDLDGLARELNDKYFKPGVSS